MSEPFLDILHTYLAPLVIAVPLALLLILLALRRGDDDRPPPRRDEPAKAPPAPPQPAAATPPVAAPIAAAVAAGPTTLLVVDDSAVARAKLKRLFEGAGFRVETAGDGSEALERLGGARFAVLVTDLEMPNMNGLELIAAVQGSLETEDLPIIAITGHDEMHARVHEIAGLYGLFKKPWNDRELLKRVSALAGLRAAPAGP
jgi:CheY-like chemotaxis protein